MDLCLHVDRIDTVLVAKQPELQKPESVKSMAVLVPLFVSVSGIEWAPVCRSPLLDCETTSGFNKVTDGIRRWQSLIKLAKIDSWLHRRD